MPPGRTAAPTTLTEEEAAALAAEQSAAYGSDYAPAPPPASDPVAAPAPQTTMYQPSSPPPAAEPYTSISPQVTDTSNPSVEPGMSAPPSERNDDYTAVNTAYQPAEPWSSISPQDSGNTSAYPVSVSDFRDPLKTPEATMAQDTRYSPADPGRANVPTMQENFTDALGRRLGLEPDPSKDPDNADMANQVARNLNDLAGDTLGSLWENQKAGAGKLLSHLPQAVWDVEKFGANALYNTTLRPLQWAADKVSGDPSDLGPFGWTPRQIQSNFDPIADTAGRLISEKLIDFGPDSSLGDFLKEGATGVGDWWQENPPESWPSTALSDIVRRGKEHPAPTTPVEGGVQTLSDLVSAVDTTIDDKAPPLRAELERQGQLARGSAIASRMQGGSPLDAALAAARPIAQDVRLAIPDIDLGGLRTLYKPVDPSTASNVRVPGRQERTTDPSMASAVRVPGRHDQRNPVEAPYDPLSSAYVPREPGTAQTDPDLIQRAREAATAAKNWAAGLEMPDVTARLPEGGRYTPRLPDGAIQGVTDRLPDISLPDAAQGVQDAVTGLIAPNVRNGRAPITVRRSPDEGIDPNALYMPEAPPPSVLDRVRDAGSDVVQGIGARIPDVNLPDVTLPDISLPGRGDPSTNAGQRWAPVAPNTSTGPGGQTVDPLQQVFEEQQSGAVRSATQPEGTSVSEKNGATWILGANSDYRGIVDPETGEYVLFPENPTQEQVDAIVDSVVKKGSSASGPATSAPAMTTTGATNAAPNTSSGAASSGGTSNSSGNGNYSDSGYSQSGRRSNGKSETYASDDEDSDSAPLKLDDFIQDFDGDGVISKRDRMQGKQAFEQAKAARSKKRRGKNGAITTRKGEAQFPFNREPSPIRQKVLGAIAESQGKKG